LTACVAHCGSRFLTRHGYGRTGLRVVREYATMRLGPTVTIDIA
jgi:hypothetical protein